MSSRFARFSRLRGEYPRQFWLMFVGMLLSTIGSSMVWPFLMIYVSTKLNLPLTQAASLMTINSGVGLASAFIAGPVIDRFGRKWMMVISLVGFGAIYLLYSQVTSYAFMALLMAATGLINPLYRVGADAMLADLIPPEKRPDAYALIRMSNNAGISIGPAIGGFLAAVSYNYAFLGAAVGMSTYGLLLAIFAKETLPSRVNAAPGEAPARPRIRLVSPAALRRRIAQSYAGVFADKPFLSFIFAFTMNQFCAALIWVLLSVYSKTHFGVPENQYGLIPATNAIMVVIFQTLVTRQTKKFPPLPVLAVGSFIYTVAVTSIAFGAGFWGFWTSMVVMTVGELMLMPTSSTYTANLAPADMRGRYMSIYGLTWAVAQGLGPLFGGILSDNISPRAPWFGGGVFGLVAVTAFLVLSIRAKARERQLTPGD